MEEYVKNFKNDELVGFIKGLEYYHFNKETFNLEFIEILKNKLNDNILPFEIATDELFIKSDTSVHISEKEELIKLNQVLEREVNLLKSLILINNLNLNIPDMLSKNYFINMCNEDNVKQIIKDEKEYNKQETLHTLIIKINVNMPYFRILERG
jgi:hypothetical protein